MKKQITQAKGWLVVKKFELILFDLQNCLIGTFLLALDLVSDCSFAEPASGIAILLECMSVLYLSGDFTFL